MISRKFRPDEILFSPTTRCNLRCAHCDNQNYRFDLPKKYAVRFLGACANAGIKRVGFSGGEPFLTTDFLCTLAKAAIRRKMLFSRIMTNGAWFKTKKELLSTLRRIFRAGYDGDICISVDAFHRQDLRKVALFIRTALALWKRPDLISIAAVKGSSDTQTRKRLEKLAKLLNAHFTKSQHGHFIKNKDLFIKIFYISLSPVGKATLLKNPWDGKWFRDDFCKGPGNVFFVLPDGTVKPCCGYGNDNEIFTIGSIKHDTVQKLLSNAQKNRFISKIFSTGLHPIRQTLQRLGVRFPGKTSNHCFFCYYLANNVARPLLKSALKS
ncbi:MAG: radical SAM protein [Candidatus Omnitrophica bacterium]|nr:radical SAM protein [Candidatus Omnitrophota bacterium]MDD5611323.1 radical SAM protein [Candidatus Omnitrophota bacterium]